MPQWSFFQTAGPTDFQNVLGISFLPANFTIGEDNFSSITENSLVVLDDFSFKFPKMLGIHLNFNCENAHSDGSGFESIFCITNIVQFLLHVFCKEGGEGLTLCISRNS